MATWTLTRPASTGLANDIDLATDAVALANSPGDFGNATAVSIATQSSAVSVPGWGDDTFGMNVRIVSGATILAATNAGGTYVTVQAASNAWSAAKSFPAINFAYVNTTATQAQWDAATIEYQQTWTKTKGSDAAHIEATAHTNAITVTYTAEDVLTADNLQSASQLSTPDLGKLAPVLTLPGETNLTENSVGAYCSTTDSTGTKYTYISTSATAPSVADLKAGTGAVAHNVDTAPLDSTFFTGAALQPSTNYYTYYIQTNSTGDSNLLESGIWTTLAVAVLSLPTEADITETSATVGCTTDKWFSSSGPNVLYYYVSTSNTAPSIADLIAGTGAVKSGSVTLAAAGIQTFATGSVLSASTTYYTYFVQEVDGPAPKAYSLILESGSWQTTGAADNLLADNLQSASQLSTPAAATEYDFLADDLQSASQLSTPSVGQTHVLTADDLQSASQLSTPTAATEYDFLADDLRSASQLSTPSAGQTHVLTADDLQSASQLSTPVLAGTHVLTADDLQSASQLSTPAVGQEHSVLADDLQSASQLSTPTLVHTTTELLVPDTDTTVGNWTTDTGATTGLYLQIDEASANDADFIQSEAAPSASAVKFRLSDPAVAPIVADTQRVTYRYGKDADDGVALDLTVSLIEGASTVIASWTHLDIPVTLNTADQVLTGPQKTAITNHSDLFIQFEATI